MAGGVLSCIVTCLTCGGEVKFILRRCNSPSPPLLSPNAPLSHGERDVRCGVGSDVDWNGRLGGGVHPKFESLIPLAAPSLLSPRPLSSHRVNGRGN